MRTSCCNLSQNGYLDKPLWVFTKMSNPLWSQNSPWLRVHWHVLVADILLKVWGIVFYKCLSRALINSYIPRNTMRCNYLSMPWIYVCSTQKSWLVCLLWSHLKKNICWNILNELGQYPDFLCPSSRSLMATVLIKTMSLVFVFEKKEFQVPVPS